MSTLVLKTFTRLSGAKSGLCVVANKAYQRGASNQFVLQAQKVHSRQQSTASYPNANTAPSLLSSVERSPQNDRLFHLKFENGTMQRYPYVWLRDNCRSKAAYHPSSYQRLSLMKDLELDVTPVEEKISKDGSMLYITWSDGHLSEYPASWLIQHRFNKTQYDPIAHIQPRIWGPEDYKNVPRYDFNEVLTDDHTLFEWMRSLHVTGLNMLVNGPTEAGAIKKLGERVGYLKTTVYGNTFQVLNKYNASSLAYTAAELGQHVDLPFYSYCPGVQMLHCIHQTGSLGGTNQFCDAYTIAEQIKQEDPEAYKLLTTVKVHFRNCGTDYVKDYHLIMKWPILQLDDQGKFHRAFYNDQVRASYLDIPVEQVQDFYRAIKVFSRKITEKGNFFEVKLKNGEVAVFNNTRVMHGRSGYAADASGGNQQERHLEGGYFDWDEMYSQMRVIYERLYGELRI